MNDDAVGLLRQLKQMAFASGGVQHPFWTLQIVIRRLLAIINQGTRESVTNYYRRFVSTTEVIEEQWGKFYPEKLAVSASDVDKNIARDKYLSMIFLARADKARFGTLIEDLNNSYLAGNDQYPVSLDGTLTLLSHYQGHRGGEHMDDNKNVSRERQVSPSENRENRSNLRGSVAGIAMNMATIRVSVPKRRRCMEHKCLKLKKMRMRKGLQVLDPDKMGLQVLYPAQGCTGQVRPRVVLHGNDNHERSNSAFFSGKIERVFRQYVPYD
jgi:hypothetical protein